MNKKTTKLPQISVVMSVFNGSAYLKEAIESILNQTLENFELVIVDDSSADSTNKILSSFKDKRLKLVKNQTNLGLAKSLNIAINHSKGKYIARMDADDVSLPERLKTQLRYLESNPQIDLCGTWANLIDSRGRVVGEKRYPTSNHDLKSLLKYSQPVIHPTWMAKSMFFKDNPYDPKFDYAEDYELISRNPKIHLANIPEVLFLWRLSDSRRSRLKMKEIDRADLEVKLRFFKKGVYGASYALVVFNKLITTYLFPYTLKTKIAELLKIS